VKTTRFEPGRDLIIVGGRIWSPREDGFRQIQLVLDTGAAETIVVPELLDELGYSPRDGEAITVIRSAVGREQEVTSAFTLMTCPRDGGSKA
jgi:hypothetical protein